MSNIKVKEVSEFLHEDSDSINTLRTLVLFGRNVSTYKFALCHTLMNLSSRSELSYEDIKDPFMRIIVDHYKKNPNQFNAGENKLTAQIALYIKDSCSWDELLTVAEKSIFNNVFDAFQNVGKGTIDDNYRLFEHDKTSKKLILTDNLNLVLEDEKVKNYIINENEARWQIVEEAWACKLSPNLLVYNNEDKIFISNSKIRRVNLRSAVDVLLPYQKGKCFYCNRKINSFALTHEDDFPDVDHFLPFSLVQKNKDIALSSDGVWNLVIACKSCNRGANGKFDAPPVKKFYEKLKKRNILYVEEHRHSLKNSILHSLGTTSKEGVGKRMDMVYKYFSFLKGWLPEESFE